MHEWYNFRSTIYINTRRIFIFSEFFNKLHCVWWRMQYFSSQLLAVSIVSVSWTIAVMSIDMALPWVQALFPFLFYSSTQIYALSTWFCTLSFSCLCCTHTISHTLGVFVWVCFSRKAQLSLLLLLLILAAVTATTFQRTESNFATMEFCDDGILLFNI